MAGPVCNPNPSSARARFPWDGPVESLLDSVNVWINVYDRDMNLIFWNSTAEKISGYSRREVLNNDGIWEWLYSDPAYREAVMEKAGGLITEDTELDSFETTIRCKDGSEKAISWSSRTLTGETGNIQGAITFGRDVTDRRLAEDALQRAHEELSVLYAIASVSSGAVDLRTILDRTLEQVLPVMDADKGIIHLWDEESAKLRVSAYRGFEKASLSELVASSSDAGIFRSVFDTEAPLALSNIREVLDDVPTTIPSKLFNAYLGVPMQARGNRVGVFSIFGRSDRSFTRDEIAMVTAIADQIGVAVDNAGLHEQSQRLAVSEERRRLARDLHDAVTQSLYSLTLFAEAGHRSLKNGDLEDADCYLSDLGATAQNALREMRLLLHELRPLRLETEGMIDAIQHRLDAVEGRVGIVARLESDGTVELPAETEEELYRIIQEALNNSLRHASARSVTVSVSDEGGTVTAMVSDDGVGFDLDRAYNQGGIGLESMSERALRIGASFRIDARPGGGTTVAVTVPKTSRSGEGPDA